MIAAQTATKSNTNTNLNALGSSSNCLKYFIQTFGKPDLLFGYFHFIGKVGAVIAQVFYYIFFAGGA